MNPPIAANIGVDNQTCVNGTNEIAEHAVKKGEAVLRTPKGAPILGGNKTRLHQNSVSRKPWQLVQNGDLWMKVEKTVIAKQTEDCQTHQAKRACNERNGGRR